MSDRDKIIIDLGAKVGLRSFEIPQVKPSGISRTADGEHYRIHVPKGKDTAGGDGKPRDAYLPADLEMLLYQYQRDNQIANDEPFIDIQPRSVREVVKRLTETAAEEYDNDDWKAVSSHDLRRHYAQRMLVNERINPRVLMAVGGWNSFDAIEPYLNEPTDTVINDAFSRIDF
nr:site-specific integrase [Haloquadratum walsbyi]